MSINREYGYNDVYLIPRKCVVGSRSECDITVGLGTHIFKTPLIAANMPSVVDISTCEFFASQGWFYIMHRFNVDNLAFIRYMKERNYVSSISVGVNEESYIELKKIKSENEDPDYITIDIALCHSEKLEKMVKFIKDTFPKTFLIAGNLVTSEAIEDLEKWGVDCHKAGIGQGRACTTRIMTGFTRPSISMILECVSAATKPIIADGGIEEPGHFAKAIAAGAHMVMAGSLFAGFEESAGDLIEIDGKKYKEYYGSASQFVSKDKKKHIEGKKILVEYKGDMIYYLNTLEESLKSSVSYAGGKDLSALQSCEIVSIN